jgi:YrbI family 3-deoxy-D-manno-octulosonate 8-phosphate phosphatase
MKNVSLVVFDFDGVMTDNHVWVHQSGAEAVRCHRGDGLGIAHLKKAGFEVIVLSTETNPVVTARCRKLKIEAIQDCDDKLAALQQLARGRSLSPGQIAYVGNDLNDVACLRWVGWPIAVADAPAEVRALAKWVTRLPGGRGAVREVADRFVLSRHDGDPTIGRTREWIWRSIELRQTLASSDELLARILRVARTMTTVLRDDGRIFLFGDEGSGADVQHLAAELGERVTTAGRAVPATALTMDVSTPPGMDDADSYRETVAGQLERQAHAGDMAVGISVSGNSPHVVRAMETARRLGLRTVALTGAAGGKLGGIGEECIPIPSDRRTSTRDGHMLIGRILCAYLERALSDGTPAADQLNAEP